MEILKIKVAKNYSFDNIVHGQERQLKFYFYTITYSYITRTKLFYEATRYGMIADQICLKMLIQHFKQFLSALHLLIVN